jgi:hypothetical protein
MLDPVTLALMNAPVSEEPVTEVEERAIEEAKASIRRGEPTMSLDDFERIVLARVASGE